MMSSFTADPSSRRTHVPTLMGAVAALGVALAGCSGVDVVLKFPVSEGCKEIQLKECDELTDGVLLYVEGKQEEARSHVGKATRANSPTELRRFAAFLLSLKKLAGTEEYMKPVFEIAGLIDYQAAQAEAAQAAGGAPPLGGPLPGAAPPAPAPVTAAAPTVPPVPTGPTRAFTADTDPKQLDGGAVAPTSSPGRGPCGPMLGATSTTCARAVDGPFVVTDVLASAECDASVFVAATAPSGLGAPRFALIGPRTLSGARLLVRKDETLIIGAPDGKTRVDPRCVVTWAGFRPYMDQ